MAASNRFSSQPGHAEVLEEAPAGASGEEFSPQSVRRIGHDLNNALATVTGYAQLLESQPDWPSHLSRQLQTLAHDAARATVLANELLELARRGEENPAATSSQHALPSAAQAVLASAGARGASVLNGSLFEESSTGALGADILVVDDEEPVITLIAEILSLDGHAVTPAFNGAEALAWTQARDFDLIISDVRMPAVGGPAFYEILLKERPDLLDRVLFVTGDTVSFSTRSFLQGTSCPVLAKPFDPDRLRALVRELLARASAASI
jgi:CheY-like chemotaxis protein